MNEVIGYVDVRAEEVAAAKADDVLEPAEQAKDDAIAAKEAAEQARDTTLAALPQIQQDITDLKAEDVALDGRLDTVELKVTTAEGNIVTIQGQIIALQTADGQNVKLNVAQTIPAAKTFTGLIKATGQGAYDPNNTDNVATIGTLDEYTPMVRNTGNIDIYGEKHFKNGLFTDGAIFATVDCMVTDRPDPAVFSYPIGFTDSNGNRIALIYCKKALGYTQIIASVTGPNGTVHDEVLSEINE